MTMLSCIIATPQHFGGKKVLSDKAARNICSRQSRQYRCEHLVRHSAVVTKQAAHWTADTVWMDGDASLSGVAANVCSCSCMIAGWSGIVDMMLLSNSNRFDAS